MGVTSLLFKKIQYTFKYIDRLTSFC